MSSMIKCEEKEVKKEINEASNSNESVKAKKERKKRVRYSRQGQWNERELQNFYIYVYHHFEQMRDDVATRTLKLLKGLSKFVKTRGVNQCRAFLKKMIKNNETLQNAMKEYIRTHSSFLLKYSRHRQQLIVMDDENFCCSIKAQEKYNQSNQNSISDMKSQREGIIGNKTAKNGRVYFDAQESDPAKGLKQQKKHSSTSTNTIPIENLIQEAKLQKQWIECHQYYLKWVSTVQRLTAKYSQ